MQKLKIQIDNHLTLREKIVETVRNAIVNGQIAAGARVAEPDLADHFGISRTPIREAFRQLESEGFITVIPRKGAIVASLSAKDISDFYDLKMVLEGYAARCATKVLTEKEMAKMEAVNRQMEVAAARKDLRKVLVLHNEFHDIFLKACGNEKLHAIVQNMVMQFQRFRLILAMRGKIEGSIRQHWEIIAAFRKRNADMAESLVIKNAQYGKKVLLRELAKG
ncbi:MAG: GntR family transcriptional regulator [Deltaproteobacteria bacterium RBG_16_64_85]|nr:MAG: GntR family transcriptional regulator [Deltaproteobacteria bacterium RBG_16_64_85]